MKNEGNDDGSIPRLKSGQFEQIKSNIPPRFLANASEEEREIAESMSVFEQKASLLNANDQVLDEAVGKLANGQTELKGRVGELEENQNKVKWGGKMLWFAIAALAGFIGFIITVIGAIRGGN